MTRMLTRAELPEVGAAASDPRRMPALRDLVVVANRLPVCAASTDGVDHWRSSPGGLVSALEPAVRSSSARWVGWTGIANKTSQPFVHGDVELFPLRLEDSEVDEFYSGFSNSTLWPLYHDAIFIPQFHRAWWASYVAVNQRFADAAVRVAPRGATIWIHDYHLELVPAMIRQQRDDVRIGFFLHIPFPSEDLVLRIPWRNELTLGMLGADVVGFQTTTGAENFRNVVARLLGRQAIGNLVEHDGRTVLVDAFPIGINAAAYSDMASQPSTLTRAGQIREEIGSPRTVLLGVDRLDYTKGIEVRLRAYRELLDEHRIDPADCVLIQIAEPTRVGVPGYSEIRAVVEHLVGAINGDHGTMRQPAVHYLHQSQTFEELVALYRAADVMLVTPFRDGMNLVAKEYVASKIDHDGVLVLSEFAGAAHQLKQAMLVNPYDLVGLKDAIEAAVNQDRTRRRCDMAALAYNVHRNNAYQWADSFLTALDAHHHSVADTADSDSDGTPYIVVGC